MGVSQYGQMTAGSLHVHRASGHCPRHHHHSAQRPGANARLKEGEHDLGGMLFVSAGLGGMSGRTAKAAGNHCRSGQYHSEVSPKAVETRHSQGWVDEVYLA